MEYIVLNTSAGSIKLPLFKYNGSFVTGTNYQSSQFTSGSSKLDGADDIEGVCAFATSNASGTPVYPSGVTLGGNTITVGPTSIKFGNAIQADVGYVMVNGFANAAVNVFVITDNDKNLWLSGKAESAASNVTQATSSSFGSNDGSVGVGFNTVWNPSNNNNQLAAANAAWFWGAEVGDEPASVSRSNPSLVFYAKAYDYGNARWIDSEYRRYSIAVYSGQDFPNYGTILYDIVEPQILYRSDNIMETVAANYGSAKDRILFCLTDSTVRNYIDIILTSTTVGNFNYEGKLYDAFGSVVAPGTARYAVVSDASLKPGTKTGQANFLSTRNSYYIYGQRPLTEESSEALIALLNLNPAQPPDPFSPGGTSEPGGGGGTFDDDDDEVGLDSKPTLSSADTGFVRIYNPTLSQVRSLAHYLFTNESWLQAAINHLKQYFESPIDAFILFNIVPCRVPDGGTDNFRVLFLDTGVQLTVAANQFVDVNCGDLVIDEYYGSALDYSPYTTISLYLPYIGNVDIDTDEVMGHTIRVAYRIDVVSGGCVAYVSRVDGSDDDQQERVLYQFSGHCAINIPFSQLDASSYISAMIQAATAVAVGVATGGAGAAAELGTEASVMTAGETAIASAGESMSLPPVMSMTPQMPVDLGLPRGNSTTPNIFEGLSPATMANTVGSVMGMKMHVQHAGGFSGNTGYLAKRRPYAIIKRPRMCNPDEYGSFNGYPSMMYERLGNLSGFTQVQQVQLTEIPCTAGEQAELMSLLKSGVIL